jgi:alpha-N-arabinofuranosidase
MKWVDPTIELVACGSSGAEMATFPEWDRVILETLYDYIDYISLHRYYSYEGDINNFLGVFFDLNNLINTIKATADYVKAKNRSKKTMYLSVDEWNVWYIQDMQPKRWQKAPSIAEDSYFLLMR